MTVFIRTTPDEFLEEEPLQNFQGPKAYSLHMLPAPLDPCINVRMSPRGPLRHCIESTLPILSSVPSTRCGCCLRPTAWSP